MISKEIKRPILRYHGGKWMLAPWIISHFPSHKVYVEPFGGAGSVLLRKQRSYAEVYNDLDSEIVNLFSVVRDFGEILIQKLELTPFSRDEYKLSLIQVDDPIEKARRTVVRAFMGFGSASVTSTDCPSGFRANCFRSGSTPSHDWVNFPNALNEIIKRLQGVVIENKDALSVIQQNDSISTLHYLDPPYLKDTRHKGQKTKAYRFEMENENHIKLLDLIKSLKGFVILSGYDHSLYNDTLSDWIKIERIAPCDSRNPRKEVLWINKKGNNQNQLSIEL